MTTAIKSLCLHCQRSFQAKPRGLCHRCYNLPEVRDLYEDRRCFAQEPPHRIDPEYFALPTRDNPGSEAKIAVMAERAAAGAPLFHPLDNGSRESAPLLDRIISSRRRTERRLTLRIAADDGEVPGMSGRACPRTYSLPI